MFFKKKNATVKVEIDTRPRWRVTKDPHIGTYAAERLELLGGAMWPIEAYVQQSEHLTEERAVEWIEREKQRPIVVREID